MSLPGYKSWVLGDCPNINNLSFIQAYILPQVQSIQNSFPDVTSWVVSVYVREVLWPFLKCARVAQAKLWEAIVWAWSRIGTLWPIGQIQPVFINKVLLESSHTHLFAYYLWCLWKSRQKLKLQYFLATWCEEPAHWKRPWCWERLKARGEVGDKGWDGWMASPTQRTWIWANSRRQWRTGKPGRLQSMGLQGVRHDLVTEQQQHDAFGHSGRTE